MNREWKELFKILGKKPQSGSDLTGIVTKVKGNTAYVQFTGSDITDTPVSLTIDAKAGDKVRVRVSGGRAWITGNDTAPPTNDTEKIKAINKESSRLSKKLKDAAGNYSLIKQSVDSIQLEVGQKMDTDMTNRASSITIDSGKMEFKANSLVVDSSNFKLDNNGNATFSGNLNAASGSFRGTLTFDWAEDNPGMRTRILIGSDNTSPLIVKGVNNDASTGIYSDMISIGANGGMTWAQMDIYDGFQWSSDKRVKSNIAPVADPEIVLQMKPVTYRFTSDPNGKTHYGFIAQDIQSLMPDAVTENKDGYLGLNYLEFIAPAIAMIQKQEKRITALEKEIAALMEGGERDGKGNNTDADIHPSV